MLKLPSKFKFQKKYLAFLTMVPILMVTSFVQTECPVCDGTGKIFNNPAMGYVRIVGIESKELEAIYNSCGMFLMYHYDVTLTLENQGEEEAVGWMKMVLVDFVDGTPQNTQYTVVRVPKGSSWEINYSLWFSSNHDEKRVTEVQTEVLTGEIDDETCNGTGEIPVNTWPLVNNLKDQFQKVNQIEIPWVPPQTWFDDEELP
ncbi:hypothetical protein ACFLYB_05910 [Chloroflexota bacterium]